MQFPVQVAFRGLPHSEEVESSARRRAAELTRYCDRIQSVHVVIDTDERRHRQGRKYQVKLRLHVPGKEIVVGDHPARLGHDAAELALTDVFKAARRRLKDYVETRRCARKDDSLAAHIPAG